jgi:hypothetical protein
MYYMRLKSFFKGNRNCFRRIEWQNQGADGRWAARKDMPAGRFDIRSVKNYGWMLRLSVDLGAGKLGRLT